MDPQKLQQYIANLMAASIGLPDKAGTKTRRMQHREIDPESKVAWAAMQQRWKSRRSPAFARWLRRQKKARHEIKVALSNKGSNI